MPLDVWSNGSKMSQESVHVGETTNHARVWRKEGRSPRARTAEAAFLEGLAPNCILNNGLGLDVWRRAPRESSLAWGAKRGDDGKHF